MCMRWLKRYQNQKTNIEYFSKGQPRISCSAIRGKSFQRTIAHFQCALHPALMAGGGAVRKPNWHVWAARSTQQGLCCSHVDAFFPPGANHGPCLELCTFGLWNFPGLAVVHDTQVVHDLRHQCIHAFVVVQRPQLISRTMASRVNEQRVGIPIVDHAGVQC